MILVYALALSVAVGWLRGGRFRHWPDNALRGLALPVLAFLLEAAFGWFDSALDVPTVYWLAPAVLTEYALLAAFLIRNRHMRGMAALGAGTLCNLLAMLTHGFAMPVSPVIHRYEALSGFVTRIASGELAEYVLVGWDSPLWWLGDTIPLPAPPGLASIGDFFMAAGLFLLIQQLMGVPTAPSKKEQRPENGRK